MASPKKRMALGATPGKLCLSVVLGIILIAVLYFELSKGGSANAQTTTAPPPRPAGARAPRSTVTHTTQRRNSQAIPSDVSQPQSPIDRDLWNAVALDSVFKHDPFAVPAAFLPPPSEQSGPIAKEPTGSAPDLDNSLSLEKQREEREKQAAAEAQARDDAMNALEKQGVNVVLRDGNQWIAVVGDKTIRVGDQLGGFRVIEILPNGVVIEDPTRDAE